MEGNTGRPRAHDEALAEVLLDEATRMVGLEGPGSLSLRRVTRAVGTSTSAIYSLYGSRDSLLDAVYQRAIMSFARATVVPPGSQPLVDLFKMGLRYRAWALANPLMYPVMFGRRSDVPPVEVRERTRATVQPLLECVERCIRGGLLDGNPREIVTQLWSSVHGFVSLELAGLLAHSLLAVDDGESSPAYETLLRASISHWRA